MDFFSFAKKDGATVAGASETGAGGVTTAQVNDARDAAIAGIQTSPRRRGRPPKSTTTGAGNQPALSSELQAEMQRQFDELYNPKAWASLMAMPADAMQTLTGREHWELSKDERDTLGITASAAARTMMITNPKSLAFLMVGSALFSAYLPRCIKELKVLREKKGITPGASADAPK